MTSGFVKSAFGPYACEAFQNQCLQTANAVHTWYATGCSQAAPISYPTRNSILYTAPHPLTVYVGLLAQVLKSELHARDVEATGAKQMSLNQVRAGLDKVAVLIDPLFVAVAVADDGGDFVNSWLWLWVR